MTDLDPRLHHLRHAPVPAGPDAAELRTRAARRRARRHRRLVFATVPVVALLVIGAAVALSTHDGSESVVTGSDPSTTAAPATPTTTSSPPSTPDPGTSMGNVDGVVVDVTPTEDLRDGQLVTVDIDGLGALTDPIVIQCAADVTAETAARSCDLTPLEPIGGSAGTSKVTGTQQVAVRRIIQLPREATPENDQGGPWDCATEPVGCALVVGNRTLPATGVGVAITFSREDLPVPEVTIAPARELEDRQEVTVTATGLRPNSTYLVNQCGHGADAVCDEIAWPSAKTDGDGTLRTTVAVHAAIYGWKGRTDCTVEACRIVVRSDAGESDGDAPLSFRSGVVAPVPRLSISPSGPYEDRQEVTVTGTGFPPGFDMSTAIGLCPADGDSAVLDGCGYGALDQGPAIVDDQGRFTTTIELFSQRCRTEAGCVLGWVLNHGPTIAKVPIEFR